MEVAFSQIHAPDNSLLETSSAQNASDRSFDNFLEQEQKRIALLFSPLGAFNFGSFFSYAEQLGSNFRPSAEGPESNVTYQMSNDPASPTTIRPTEPHNASDNQFISQPLPYEPQKAIQDILLKLGWLAPNLEASPLFFQSQMEGKLLSKLDLQFLVDQIVNQVKMVTEKGKTELTIGLRPEELGNILLTLTSKSGMISINIQADEKTRKELENIRHELELALKKSNINLAGIVIEETKEVKKHA